jgi:hypothetical protein
MEAAIRVFASDPTIVAVANIFALITGAAFIVAVVLGAWRFATNAYQTSFLRALKRSRYRWNHVGYRCSKDLHVYISMLAAYASIMACTVIGMTALVVAELRPEDRLLSPMPVFNRITLYIYMAIFFYGAFRLLFIVRRVLKYRRKMRLRDKRERAGAIRKLSP